MRFLAGDDEAACARICKRQGSAGEVVLSHRWHGSGRQRLRDKRPRLTVPTERHVPRFFIDTSDQRTFVRDEIGLDFADAEAARDAAVGVLPDMARDTLPDGDTHSFLAVLRDEHDRTVLQATLVLNVEWLP